MSESKVVVTFRLSDPLAHLEVLDHDLARVELDPTTRTDPTTVTVSLVPGLYKVRQQLAGWWDEQVLEVGPDSAGQVIALHLPDPPEATFGPGPSVDPARALFSARGSDPQLRPAPWEQTRRTDGAPRSQLRGSWLESGTSGRVELDAEDGIDVEVEPGGYVWWVPNGARRVGRPFFVPQGMRLSVTFDADPESGTPDALTARVATGPIGRPPDPKEGWRTAELAQAVDRGIGTSSESLRTLLADAAPDPLVLILALHAVLDVAVPDRSLYEELFARACAQTRPWPVPDLVAIAVRATGFWPDADAGLGPVTVPPMVRRGWAALVRGSWGRDELVVPGSLADRLSGWEWGTGTWTTMCVETRRVKRSPLDVPADWARILGGVDLESVATAGPARRVAQVVLARSKASRGAETERDRYFPSVEVTADPESIASLAQSAHLTSGQVQRGLSELARAAAAMPALPAAPEGEPAALLPEGEDGLP